MPHPTRFLLLSILLLPPAAPALAQQVDEAKLGWASSAELTFVDTAGNSETSTLGLGGEVIRTFAEGRFALRAAALRAESIDVRRGAVGTTPDDFRVVETSDTTLTAENYLLRARYDHDLRGDFFWYAGLGWERNEFAGFSGRTSAVAGLGNTWFDDDDARWRTDYGLTYTRQDDLVDNPALSDGFLGARLTSDLERRLTPSTVFANLLIVDQNLDETEDLRADLTTSVAVSISERLALRVALQLLYDNLPSLVDVELILPDGAPTGTFVPVALDDLDTVLSTALVISF